MPFPKKLQLCLIVVAFAKMATAQPVNDLRFEKINGLSQNTVYSIMKDKLGFMWIATADGLNRYDGVEMKVYKPPPEKKLGELRGRTIRTMVLEDDEDQLWFSTELTAFRFNKKNNFFQDYNFARKGTIPLELGLDPIVQAKEMLWFANSSYGMIAYNTITQQHQNFNLLDSSGKIIFIQPSGVYDNKNSIWFASNKGLFAFNIIEKKWQQYLPGNHLYKITISGDTVYACAGKEIFYINIITHQAGKILFAGQTKDIIRTLYTDYKQNVWAGGEKGNVYCKIKNTATFSHIGNINGEGTNQTVYPIYCFYVDELGTLWVGADVLGLLRTAINPTGFNVYPLAEEKKKTPNFFVTSIYEDDTDKVWLGTFQMGLVALDKRTGKTSTISPGNVNTLSINTNIGFIKKDSNQNFWIAANDYLFVKEKNGSTFKTIKIPLPVNSLAATVLPSSFAAYKNGWLLGTSLGLYFLTKKNNEYFFEYLTQIGQSKISDIWIDKKNAIWIGFEGLGLFISKDLAHLNESDILFAETGIKSFLYDEPYNLLWISTQSGLIAYHLLTQKYKNFTEQNGLGNSYVYGALKNNSDLWLSTNRGLSKATVSFKKDEVLPDLSFTNFTSNDGLPNDEFNTGAFYKGNTGNFYFGTIKGAVWFNPGLITPNQYLPIIVMTSILVNEVVADSSLSPEYISNLRLPYFKNNLFFRFRGLEFSNPTKVNYAYKLEGWDKDWVYSGNLNEVRYNNLPHGDYIFKVKAENGSGVWNEKAYSLTVIIAPPFWKTWWFYLLVTAIAIAAIILTTKNITSHKLKKEIEKLEQQKALEEERLRISQEMHDDIGAGLTQISLISEAAKTQTNSGNEIHSELDDISFTSRQLVDNISEIIWALNPNHNSLDTLLAHLREQLNKLLEYTSLNYEIHFPAAVPSIELDDKQRRNILLVTKEIVHNAVKHSNAARLTITATLDNNLLSFIITDDGNGFDNTAPYHGNGLKNINNRIKELKGNVTVKTEKEKGTIFMYSFVV